MRRQIALIMICTLLFSAIFNIGPGGALTVNAASSGPELEYANIEDWDEDVYAYEVFELEFDKDIKRHPKKYGEIELYNRDRSRSEKVEVTIDGNMLIIEPVKRMEYSADYRLLIEEEYIVTDDESGRPLAKNISFRFTVEDDYWGYDDDDDRDYALRGKTFGATLGEIEGQLNGYTDSLEGKKNNWSKAISTSRKIIDKYNLSKETTEYRNAFMRDFRDSFKKAYEEAFREENFKEFADAKEKDGAMDNGKKIGELEGELYGKLDYNSGKKNNWESALPSDSVIIEKYGLNRETAEYKENFLREYRYSFRDSYHSVFREENMDIAKGGLDAKFISMDGGDVESHDKILTLKIEAGSFYEETGISIEKNALYGSFSVAGMTQATNSYNVKVQNRSNSVSLKKPIIIEFKYHGPKEGGIYEFKNGRWTYLYSQFKSEDEDNKIYAEIHTNRYIGGTYAVFIDEAHKTMDDIGGHWAARSIETFLRRNYINGYPDRTFRPDQSITRAEIVKILDDVYGWSMYSPYTHASINFKDSSIFGVFASSISKAVSLGYVKGHTDNTFRPHIPITYQEVEWLMQRITGRQDFKWYTVAEKISKDYFVRSKSYNSKDNYITRAEVVYLLHSLEEGSI